MTRPAHRSTRVTIRLRGRRRLDVLAIAWRGVLLCACLLAPPVVAAEPSSAPQTNPALPAVPGKQNAIEASPGEGSKSARPALDLATLEKRLKETDAIGVFTKLAMCRRHYADVGLGEGYVDQFVR